MRILEKKGYFYQVLARFYLDENVSVGSLEVTGRRRGWGRRLPFYLGGGGGGSRGPLPELFKKECNLVQSGAF